ncbi:protease HtpX [Ostreibacterium oceani]|uniref:Protease HtpX n=1 Tax=Ostreibacterium oceani TaxID=2654998 RepID=A0A6N7EUF5_9GAMM|nr:protease HtpX [Ostreibacterium oceani]MPV85255.1 protease HtpX [Ostreibacterium oceani]
MKAITLLVATNLAVMLMISVVVKVLGLEPMLQQNGLNLTSLFLISAVFGFAGSFFSLLMSKNMAKRSMGVQVINEPSNQVEAWIYNTVKSQSDALGIKMPEVGIFDSPAPNAFATGASKNNSLVAVSTGLLQVMTKDEVEAVIGHEMAHVNNGDMVTSTLLQGVLNTFVFFFARIIASVLSSGRDGQQSSGSYFMVMMVMQMVLGLFASMIVMWFSRYREFKADLGGAQLTSATSMANALRALMRVKEQNIPTALPDRMAAFGITAFGGLLSTHPPLEKRIAALENNPIR